MGWVPPLLQVISDCVHSDEIGEYVSSTYPLGGLPETSNNQDILSPIYHNKNERVHKG